MPPAEKEYIISFCGYCSAVRCMQLLYGVFAAGGACQSGPVLAIFIGRFFPAAVSYRYKNVQYSGQRGRNHCHGNFFNHYCRNTGVFHGAFCQWAGIAVSQMRQICARLCYLLRNIPALVWAFILFSSLGIGTGVGFAALLITSFAFMVRAFTETMEDISVDCLEAWKLSAQVFGSAWRTALCLRASAVFWRGFCTASRLTSGRQPL